MKTHDVPDVPHPPETAMEFLKRAIGFRVVSTNDLTPVQIADARITGRLFVDEETSLGWVMLGTGMSTGREQAAFGMTAAEKMTMNRLVEFWNLYTGLPNCRHSNEDVEVMHAVHRIQGVLATRVARRTNPEIWS